MRIGFLSTDWGDHQDMLPGGCTWVRMFHPQISLQKYGIETFIGEIGWDDNQGFVCVHPVERLNKSTAGVITEYPMSHDNLDVVVLKLFMHKDASNLIEKARSLGQTVIIDTDDHFENLPSDNMAHRTTDPKNNPDNNRSHFIKSYSKANGIIASTDFLYEKMCKFNQNVHIVENSLFPEHFIRRHDSSGNKPVIGWIGMMHWRTDDIKDMAGILKPFVEKHDLRIHHSGAVLDTPSWFADILGIDAERLTTLPPARPMYYPNMLMPIDIGIVPLTNNSFNEAKSYLKGLEFVFSNIPFVATGTKEYKKLSSSGIGRTATKPSEWIRHLESLLDPEVRKAEAEKSYNLALQNHNIHNVSEKWLNAIMAIHEGNTKRRG